MTDARTDSRRVPTTRLTTVSAHGGSVSFDVPADWETIVLSEDAGVVAALEPDRGGLFRTNFVLTAGPVDGPLGDWQRQFVHHDEEVADHLLLDHEELGVGGHAGSRRLTTHWTPARESVTTESWSTVVCSTGVTLTANVGTLRLTELSPLIDAVASSLVVREAGCVQDDVPGHSPA
ncbi:MAG: hypothetical protein HOQ27_00995 [Dermatophilaceae bacterium]|nr:hypothetical protein [Dermatophilaceae bacterium]